eukprot:NODE_17307_length_163_cov_7.605263_g16566_i0.p2 GENE.NODE_17307_length_163_cov_7.605263_g16566_i0~~NODE_17307_length_163_cov_7.605263_g16566_i0.p2  ORF type:complete len:53 (+),score=14.98 NODE_17307_length_163_cov_7.605263_g16566_i0:22-159(+)
MHPLQRPTQSAVRFADAVKQKVGQVVISGSAMRCLHFLFTPCTLR